MLQNQQQHKAHNKGTIGDNPKRNTYIRHMDESAIVDEDKRYISDRQHMRIVLHLHKHLG
jgi:hypothetical protein